MAAVVVLTIFHAIACHTSAHPVQKRQSSTESGDFYLVANGSHLLAVDLRLRSVRALQSTGGGVVSIHFNASTSQIVLCNNRTNEIRLTGINAGDPTTLIVEEESDGQNKNRMVLKLKACAVDWTTRRLYWINGRGGGRLVYSDFSGRHDTLLEQHTDYETVQSMAIDSSITDKTVLYYTRQARIGKVEISPSGRVTRTKDVIGGGGGDDDDDDDDDDGSSSRPYISLALNGSAGKLYWIEDGVHGAQHYDLKTRKSGTITGARRPIAIAVSQSTVAVIETSSIRTVDSSAGTTFMQRNVDGVGGDLTAIAAFSAQQSTAVAFPTSRTPLRIDQIVAVANPTDSTSDLKPTSASINKMMNNAVTKPFPENGKRSTGSVTTANPTTGEPTMTSQQCSCQNGGTCVEEKAEQKIVCKCPSGYAGELCDLCVNDVRICDADEANPEFTSSEVRGSGLFMGVGIASSVVLAILMMLVALFTSKPRKAPNKSLEMSTVTANKSAVVTERGRSSDSEQEKEDEVDYHSYMEVSDGEEKDDSADDYLEPDANPDDYLQPEGDYDNRLTLANEIVSARSQFATSSNATPLYDNNDSAMAFVRANRPLPSTHTYDNKF